MPDLRVFTRNTSLLMLLLMLGVSAFAQSRNGEIVTAADKFLATLTPEQRQKVSYAFDDPTQRARWSNFPTGFVARGGISLKQMTPIQREAAMKLLATVLSPMGLEKVNEIRQADDDFKANGSKHGPGGKSGPGPGARPPNGQNGPPGGGGSGPPGVGRAPGGRPNFSSDDMFGSDLYYISLLGKPSISTPWMLQFGGHHLALNITIAGSRGVLTPTLTGAQPASFKLDGRTIRPIGRESDKALGLLQSLNDNQRRQAVLSYTVADLVLGPGQDGKKIVPEGLKASAMTAAQQMMLLGVMAEWAGIINKQASSARMKELKADMNETWFAWSGLPPRTPAPTSRHATASRVPTSSLSTRRSTTSRPIMYTRCTAIPRTTMEPR